MTDIKKIKRLPQNDATNAWNTILPERRPHASLSGDIKCDWLVIGAGYAGLAAARRLAQNRPDEKIVIVEAGRCGENASGRNSGFAIDLPHTTSSNLDELNGAHRYMRLARAAIAELEALVGEHQIECDWSRDGKYHGAVTEEGARDMLEPFTKELEALDEPYQWVESDDLAAKLGTRHFHRAVYTPGCVLMNPAALVRGLADSLPENVTLHENSPVEEITYANGVSVKTASGSVTAPRMILAANGFSDQFGFAEQRFVHLALAASLTRPLTAAEQEAYGVEKPWGLTPANGFGGITMRYTNDHRLLIRQDIRVAMQQSFPRQSTTKIGLQHKKLFDDRFPNLPNVTMENAWVGYICMSRNGAPMFGQVAPNVWMATCQNGIGVTKGTIGGLLAADMACGEDNPLIADMQSLGEPTKLPPRPLVEVGARATINWEVWKNRREA
ncbi:MAG: FAD-dependent oxidoreductase [Rhizobiaceae bacterium]|nr:FAD-binding oxidoreductase [Hyphomicrobiales bacterium]NRB32490.1 FAD-dependent oxidoreductase [Rhizobiaceae bacterium]